jgi:Glycosyl transferases group 1
LLLAQTLAQEGYDTSLITRFETNSALRQSGTVRLLYKFLDGSQIMQRAMENRNVGTVRSFSTDPRGVMLGRLIGEIAGRSAQQRFDRSRMWNSAKVAAKLINEKPGPELVIAADGGALELLEAVGGDVPVVVDVAHPHPKEVDRCRRIATIRYPDYVSSWDDPSLEASGWRRIDQALTRAKRVWTASRYTADSIRTYVDAAIQIDVVGYGIGGVSQLSRKSNYRGRYLFVGSVGLRKGVPLLLEAWARSGLGDEGGILDVVGRKLDSQIEIALARTAGVRRHVDISSESLRTMFYGADVLLSPSYCEGFGRVLIEALSVGLPFLATRTGAVGDILGDDLKEWQVEVDDVEGFTDMIQRFHGQSSSRAQYADAVLRLRDCWTEKAYGSRLRAAVGRACQQSDAERGDSALS